jgi:tetratricopeptide (TPR) repeat protein
MHFRDRLVANALSQPDAQDDAELTRKLGLLEDAFEQFDAALDHPEGSAERVRNIARGYAALLPITKRAERDEFTALARNAFEVSLQIDPNVEGAYLGLGTVELYLGNPGQALGWFERELQVVPDSAQAHLASGLIYRGFGNDIEALRHFLSAEGVAEPDPQMLAYAACIQINPKHKDAPPLRVQGELVPVYDPQAGLARAERAAELAPDDPIVLDNLALASYANGDLDRAIELMQRLLAGPADGPPGRRVELQTRLDGFLFLRDGTSPRPEEFDVPDPALPAIDLPDASGLPTADEGIEPAAGEQEDR